MIISEDRYFNIKMINHKLIKDPRHIIFYNKFGRELHCPNLIYYKNQAQILTVYVDIDFEFDDYVYISFNAIEYILTHDIGKYIEFSINNNLWSIDFEITDLQILLQLL